MLKLLGIAAAATAIAVTVPSVLADEPPLSEAEIEAMESQIARATFGALAVGIAIFKRTHDPLAPAVHIAAFWASTDKDVRERYPAQADRILDGAGNRVADQLEWLMAEVDRRTGARKGGTE